MNTALNSQTSSNSQTSVGTDNRRAHERIPGPFDGRRVGALVTPVSIYDLSEGGCFINAIHAQRPGIVFRLEIDLPCVGCVSAMVETLGSRAEFGFAVRFVEIDFENTIRLQQALDDLKGQGF
jgi:hypothetical protein